MDSVSNIKHSPLHGTNPEVPVEAQNGLHFIVAQFKVKHLAAEMTFISNAFV